MRLKEQQKSKEASAPFGSNYNSWTKDQLIREVISIDNAIARFTKENENLMHENKKQKEEIQELNSLLYKESQKLQDYRHRIVKETGSVLVVEDEKDLHAKVLNDLGIDHAITQKEYNDLKEKLYKAEKRLADFDQESSMKEIDYKNEIDKIREQRVESERKLINLDSALKTQISMNDKLKEEFGNAMSKLQSEKDEVEQKLGWYMENQDMLGQDYEKLKEKDARIEQLKEEILSMKTKDGGKKRISSLEKQVKDLQEALTKKNPDSIPMLLNAIKPSIEEQEEYRKLKQENEKLKKTIQEKDDEFDKKIRNLRVEIDKMKARYEKTSVIPVPADVKDKRIQDLERQLQETKDYYQDRIKKLQGEKPTKSEEKISKIKGDMKQLKEVEGLKKEISDVNKSKKALEKDIRELKKQLKERPADLSLAIKALMDEDYVF
jgi:chromosome segregation ATPase